MKIFRIRRIRKNKEGKYVAKTFFVIGHKDQSLRKRKALAKAEGEDNGFYNE